MTRTNSATRGAKRAASPSNNGFAPPENVEALARTKLDESGLTLDDAKALGMSFHDAQETKIFTPIAWLLPSLRIPYFTAESPAKLAMGATGKLFYRVRALRTPEPPDPDFKKYLQPPNSGVRAYFPRIADWRAIVQDTGCPIIITEGEVKSAKACKEGFACIGLGGVNSYKAGGDLLPELLAINWRDRPVVIIFDTDPAAKTVGKVIAARQDLTNRLVRLGATVKRIDLPDLGNGKVGLDDFLVAREKLALQELIDSYDWTSDFQYGANGPYTNLANALVALRGAPELSSCFAHDQMLRRTVVFKALPGRPEMTQPRPLTDGDALSTLEWVQTHGRLPMLGKEIMHGAIIARGHENSFHPVRDYLRSLKWDRKPRLSAWLRTYLGAEGPAEYLTAVSRMFLISMVARVMEPGCRADHTLVLEGRQGARKSTVCEILGGQWYGDGLPDLNRSQDVSQFVKDKWVVEIAELAAVGRADQESLKAFITRRTENYRPSYGRELVSEPRQGVLIGTTNNSDYLRDPTGARRFWPVRVGDLIDTTGLRAVRDQILAEAVLAYIAGEHWWPSEAMEEALFRPQQAERFESDVWEGPIVRWLEEGALFGQIPVPVTVTNVAKYALESSDTMRLGTVETRRITSILRRLGWDYTRTHGARIWTQGPKAVIKFPAPGTKPSASEQNVVSYEQSKRARKRF